MLYIPHLECDKGCYGIVVRLYLEKLAHPHSLEEVGQFEILPSSHLPVIP